MTVVEMLNPLAQHLVEFAFSSLIPGLVIGLLVWGVQRIARLNAATNYLIWFVTLLVVAASPLLARIDPASIRPSSPTATATVPDPTAPAGGAAIRPPASTGLQSEGGTVSPPQTSEAPQVVPSNVPSSPAERLPTWLTFRPIHLPQLLTWFLFGAYFMGIVILLAQLVRSHLSLAQLKRTSSPFNLAEEHFDRTVLQAGRRTVALRYSEQITVPMAAGLNHPMILIPKDLEEQLGKAELEHVILHELAHLARRDDWTKLIQRILQTLLFFHPAVHFIGWRLSLEREVASDDWVIAKQGQERRGYASSLVRLVELALHTRRMRQPLVEGSAVMVKTQIEKRIKLLLNTRRRISSRISSSRLLPGLALVIVGGFLLAQLVPLIAVANVSTEVSTQASEDTEANPTLVRLTNDPAFDNSPAWSPDRQKVAFDSNRDGNREIYVMNADGTGVTRLTDNPATDGSPTWSPDGERIAFESDRDGNFEIFVMNADGSGQINITNSPADDSLPAWSPDGEKIAFSSSQGEIAQVFVMNADGSGQIKLTNDSGLSSEPDWSPDGKKIVFASWRGRNQGIYVMNADGSDETQIRNGPDNHSFPDWSPDGKKIAFVSNGDGNFEIYVMNADGSSVDRLTDDPAPDGVPDWSPDGTRIAFASFRDGNREIYVMDTD